MKVQTIGKRTDKSTSWRRRINGELYRFEVYHPADGVTGYGPVVYVEHQEWDSYNYQFEWVRVHRINLPPKS